MTIENYEFFKKIKYSNFPEINFYFKEKNQWDILKDLSYKIFEEYKLFENFKNYKEYIAEILFYPKNNLTACEAHGLWKISTFSTLKGCCDLPKVNDNPNCPENICVVRLLFIQQYKNSMGNWWGFSGCVLSIIIDIDHKMVWDARGQEAT